MKEVQYTFRVPDFCPEHCKKFSPFARFGEELICLNGDACTILMRQLEKLRAGGDAGPGEKTEAADEGDC